MYENHDYVNISLSTILRGIMLSHKEGNEKLSNELKNIYFKATSNVIVFPKKIPIVEYLENISKSQKSIQIDENVLLNALGIAKAKYNYEMERKLNFYYRSYMDAIRDGKSDMDIMVKILSDKELVNFIEQNNSLEKYVSFIKQKKKKKIVKIIGIPEAS